LRRKREELANAGGSPTPAAPRAGRARRFADGGQRLGDRPLLRLLMERRQGRLGGVDPVEPRDRILDLIALINAKDGGR
jgi:hypothetical protein